MSIASQSESIRAFQGIVQGYFDKARKHLPKQYSGFKEFLSKMSDSLKSERSCKLGKYAIVFKLTINMKSSKLKELALPALLNLVSCGFVDGTQDDQTYEYFLEEYSELFDAQDRQQGKKPMIESLIYSVTQCLVEKDELIVYALKLLVAFTTIPQCNVSATQLVKIMRTIIYVYTQSKSPVVDRLAKTALMQILNLTFQAVEQDTKQSRVSIKDDQVNKISKLMLLHMVDDLCLFEGTCMRAVPSRFEQQAIQQFMIMNELNIKAGSFGWCIMCRNPADLYCKDHRVPVCSYLCKKKHMDYVETAQRNYDLATQHYNSSLSSALQLFDALSRLLSPKASFSNVKNQQILLELILYILEIPEFPLFNHPSFIRIIKETLCGQLLKYCLETEKTLVALSFKIFQTIVQQMRRVLKNEIAIFINQIFINILCSINSIYYHRQLALECLTAIMECKGIPLEFYINYDCSMQHECLIEKVIKTLNSIVVGQIYQKSEYQTLLSPQQDLQLKVMAAQLLSTLVEGLQGTFDQFFQQDENQQKEIKQDDDDESAIPIVNPLELQRQKKQEQIKGLAIFNKNPEKGIKYLIQANILMDNEVDIAKYLRENKQLSKDQVGQYLGGHHPLQIKVLSEYTDLLSFKNMTVEEALRYYLDQFTLPGEAQQVDRIVQKFSDKYCRDNEHCIFKSSNAVYTFTYLLVMLQTDLHNPSVEEKMKLSDFQKLAKSIHDGEELPIDYMQATYQSILKKPLAIHEKAQEQKFLQESITQSLRKRQDQFQRETSALLKKSKEMIRNQQDSVYIEIDSGYLIKPLLEIVGDNGFSVFLAVFNLEIAENNQILQMSVKSLLTFIRLCSYFCIPLEGYMTSLIKATSLNQLSGFHKIHMQLIQHILMTVPSIGNGLREGGWKNVLEMISRLDELRMVQQNKNDNDAVRRVLDTDVQIITVLPDLQLEFELIDKVFVMSKTLDNDAIQEFIVALCNMSKLEIYHQYPRLFSLQKLVEVSDYNMDRVKLIWVKMWSVVRDHINEVAIKEKKVAMYAVDSLKQLSIKFLQKDELYNFQFQREVLRPFETIYLGSDAEIREFILTCIHSIVLNHKDSLKSGWRVIFDLINLGLKEESEGISRISYLILKRIMSHNLEILQDVFVDLIQSLSILGRSDQEELALASIEFATQCLHYLSAQAQVLPKKTWDDLVTEQQEEDLDQSIRNTFTVQQLETFWVPLLGMLSGLAGDKRTAVQANSMDLLFSLLHQYGYAFSIEFWKIVFQVVLRPLFDEIQFTFQQHTNYKTAEASPISSKENSWFKDSCKKGFTHITNLMARYFHKLRELLPDLLKLFENCVQNQNERLAKFSLSAVKNMNFQIGKKFSKQDWDEIVGFLNKMFKSTTPSKLFNTITEPTAKPQLIRQQSFKSPTLRTITEESYTQCVSQLQLIQITKDIVEKFHKSLHIDQLSQLDACCNTSYQFAKAFNAQIEQRYLMWKNGFMADMKQLPGLLKQEREAQACILTIKYHILAKVDENTYEMALQQYLNILLDAVLLFNMKHQAFQSVKQVPDVDTYEGRIAKLKHQEIERETINARTLLDTYILPKILQLSMQELQLSNNQLFEALLNASQYTSDISMSQLMCIDCKDCLRCAAFNKSGLDKKVRECLRKLYELK